MGTAHTDLESPIEDQETSSLCAAGIAVLPVYGWKRTSVAVIPFGAAGPSSWVASSGIECWTKAHFEEPIVPAVGDRSTQIPDVGVPIVNEYPAYRFKPKQKAVLRCLIAFLI